MANVLSRTAPFAGQTDAPSGPTGFASRFAAVELGRNVGLGLVAFFYVAAPFVLWRCLVVGISKPVPLIVMISTAALLVGVSWLVRLSVTGRLPRMVFARGPSVVGRPATMPAIEDGEPSEPADDVMQQLTLRTTPAGQELSGWLRMPVVAGQRSGTLHVAFCPPFDRIPEVEAEPVSGPDCRIKAAEPMPYGVRLEIKLGAAAREDGSVLVWFFAACASNGGES